MLWLGFQYMFFLVLEYPTETKTWFDVRWNEKYRYYKYPAIKLPMSKINKFRRKKRDAEEVRMSYFIKIGSDTPCRRLQKICNGPLKHGTSYWYVHI